MAKSLEEHLYRSAKSKEEYMDVSTLKTRLQAIAHGLEVHRSTDSNMSVNTMNPLDASSGAANTTGDQNWSVATALRSSTGELNGLSSLLAQSNPGPLASSPHLNPNHLPIQGSAHQSSGTMGSYQGANVQQQGGALPYRQGVTLANPMMTQSSGLDKDQGLAYQPQGSSTRGSSPSTSFLNELDNSQDVDLFSLQSHVGGRDGNQQNQTKDSWAQVNNSNPSTNLQSKNTDFPIASKFEDPTDAQKMRVILQQQQRLLLLRHASKCTAGSLCTTKFCEQMVTLWKHMKTCRNKNCKTSHCLSSRCVLNHYRVCKSNGRTLMCEVCGPVMLKIKQQERDDGTTDDPLTRDQEMLPGEQRAASVVSLPSGAHHMNEQSQLHMVQAVQTKLKAQLDILKLLQKHQEQLLEQQKRLESQAQNISDPNSPEFLQLQEQQVLLQQLQKRCQQQQLLIQHEIQMPTVNSTGTTEPSEQYLLNASNEPTITSSSDIKYSGDTKTSVPKQSETVGKRSGKSLIFPPSRKSKSKNTEAQLNSTSVNDRLAKKTKIAPKPKSILSTSHSKPESEAMQKKMEEDHMSQLSCMTSEEIRKHLESLNKRIVLSSRTVTHKCRPILQELMDDQFGWVFHDAVDPVALGLPDYFDVIKNPMHMDLIRKKLENAIYPDMDSFAHDMRLVFQNSILYNGESSEVGELAQSMMSRFEKLFSAVQAGKNCFLSLSVSE
jgi:Bromodomain/TAZ zinc finger